MYHPYLIGEKVYLRGIEKEDLKGDYFQWSNDWEVTKYMFRGERPSRMEILEEYYNSVIRSPNDIELIIVDKKTDKPVGNAGLHSINWIGRAAEYRIMIGDKKSWNRGYGTEVAKLMLFYAFDRLNMNRVWLGVNAELEGGIRSYKKAGFKEEGTLRQEQYRNGRHYDIVRMSVLREEYYKQQTKE